MAKKDEQAKVKEKVKAEEKPAAASKARKIDGEIDGVQTPDPISDPSQKASKAE